MFEKFLSVDAGDFRQRYEGTYGYYTDKKKGARLLTLLSTVDTNASPKKVHFEDCRGVKFYVNADSTEEIGWEFLPPRSAFYNTTDGVFYVQRIAARQFQRGITGRNTKIWKVTEKGFDQIKVAFDSLIPIFEKQVPFAKAALKWSETGEASALSPNFCLYKNKLAINIEVIGESSSDRTNISLTPTGAIFLPELVQALRNCGLGHIKVETKDD